MYINTALMFYIDMYLNTADMLYIDMYLNTTEMFLAASSFLLAVNKFCTCGHSIDTHNFEMSP